MPLKRSPAATVYEVGLTRERKGEGAWGRERRGKRNLEEASYPNRAPIWGVTFYQLRLSCLGSQWCPHSSPSSTPLFISSQGAGATPCEHTHTGLKSGMEAWQGWQLREPEAKWRPACSQLVQRKFLDVKALKTSFLCKHVCFPVILKRSFHLIRLSRLIKIQQFAHCFFKSGEASWKTQTEGFCIGDNKRDDFLNPSLSSSIRDK